MAVAITARVLAHAPQRGALKLLLVVLADYANADGLCWPGIRILAQTINETERHTIRLLGQLEEQGAIATRKGGGRGHMTTYAVIVGLSPTDQTRIKGVLQNTVVQSTERRNSDIWGRNSDMSGQETVTSGAETVTSGVKPDRPFAAYQSAKTAQNGKGIHEDPIMDPYGSGGEGKHNPQPAPPSPAPTPTPSASEQPASAAEQAISAAYPKLRLTTQQRAAIRETVTDIPIWERVLTMWRENGYKPQPGNLLDRYRKETASEAHRPRRSGPPTQQEERPAGSGPPPGINGGTPELWASWGVVISPANARTG